MLQCSTREIADRAKCHSIRETFRRHARDSAKVFVASHSIHRSCEAPRCFSGRILRRKRAAPPEQDRELAQARCLRELKRSSRHHYAQKESAAESPIDRGVS